MQDTVKEVRTNSLALFSYGAIPTDVQVLNDQVELMKNRSVRTQDVVLKTRRKRWTIETNSVREFGKSVLVACHDHNDDIWI